MPFLRLSRIRSRKSFVTGRSNDAPYDFDVELDLVPSPSHEHVSEKCIDGPLFERTVDSDRDVEGRGLPTRHWNGVDPDEVDSRLRRQAVKLPLHLLSQFEYLGADVWKSLRTHESGQEHAPKRVSRNTATSV